MSDTPKTNAAQHNMGSVIKPHYVVDVEVARDLERELAEVKEQLRLCNVDQFEYICKCGLRVTPHWCKTDKEF